MTKWALQRGSARCGGAPDRLGRRPAPTAKAATGPPNIVVILTDDQRYDGVVSMPNVRQLLVAHGVQFTHAFDNNPLCCPARATILTGQSSGRHGRCGGT